MIHRTLHLRFLVEEAAGSSVNSSSGGDPFGSAAKLDAGANILGSFLSMFYQDWHSKKNWERQRQLIDEQRAYDSPAAQMARFKAAGLNPNLIYGQMGNSAAAPAQADSPANPFSHGTNFIGAAIAKKQSEEIDSRVNVNDANAAYFRAKEKETLANVDFYDWRKRLYDSGIKLNEQKTKESEAHEKEIYANVRVADERVNEIAANIKYLDSLKNLTDEKAKSERIDNLTRHALNKARLAVLESEYKLNSAQASKLRADATYAWKSLENRLSIIANEKEMSDSQKKQAAADAVKAEMDALREKIGQSDDGDLNAYGYAMAILNDIAGVAGQIVHIGFGSSKANVTTTSQKKYSFDDD